MQEYRKKATVKAKLFEKGDEDGFITRYTDGKKNKDGSISTWAIPTDKENQKIKIPYVKTLENDKHMSRGFGMEYICVGIRGERWLVEKSIFEETYEPI